jgi:hypothetical protein
MNDKNTKKKYTIMSGGTFDYSQRTIELIADDIEQTILEAGRKIPDVLLEEQQHRYSREMPLEEQYYPSYNRKTMDIMKRAVYVLRMAYIYSKRVDWMLSGDDSEESLAKRLEEDLQALKTKYPSGKFTFKETDVYFDKECERYMLMDN